LAYSSVLEKSSDMIMSVSFIAVMVSVEQVEQVVQSDEHEFAWLILIE
jgi:hypothetical protein